MATLPLSCKLKMHRAMERRWGIMPFRSIRFFHISDRKWAAHFVGSFPAAGVGTSRFILTANFTGRDNRMEVTATSMVIISEGK